MAETIITSFDSPVDAQRAARELRREGFASTALTVMSSEPLTIDVDEVYKAPKSRIGLCAVFGGVVGAAGAIALTVGPSRSVAIVTGGMPIVTPWPFAIIVFELTALCAILASLVRMIVEAKLVRRGALDVYDVAVSDDQIVLAVECRDADEAAAASQALKAAGGRELRRN
jgi:hypothetical protein